FMGGEFGQWREWNHDAGLDWHVLDEEPHRKLEECVRALATLYRETEALHAVDFHWSGFQWIDFHDADGSVVSFLRKGRAGRQPLVVVGNFTPVPRLGYRIGVPEAGFYREIYNSDAAAFWGSNLGNLGGVPTDAIAHHGRPFSLRLTLPPLGVLYLRS